MNVGQRASLPPPPPHYPRTLSPTWPSCQEDPQQVPFLSVFLKCIFKKVYFSNGYFPPPNYPVPLGRPVKRTLSKCFIKVYFQSVCVLKCIFLDGYFPPPHYPRTLSPTWPSSQEDPQLVFLSIFWKIVIKQTNKIKAVFLKLTLSPLAIQSERPLTYVILPLD